MNPRVSFVFSYDRPKFASSQHVRKSEQSLARRRSRSGSKDHQHARLAKRVGLRLRRRRELDRFEECLERSHEELVRMSFDELEASDRPIGLDEEQHLCAKKLALTG